MLYPIAQFIVASSQVQLKKGARHQGKHARGEMSGYDESGVCRFNPTASTLQSPQQRPSFPCRRVDIYRAWRSDSQGPTPTGCNLASPYPCQIPRRRCGSLIPNDVSMSFPLPTDYLIG